MKNVVVLGSKMSGTKNNPDDIRVALLSRGVKAAVVYWEDIVVSIYDNMVHIADDNGNEIFSQNIDLVIAVGWYRTGNESIYRDLAFATALYFDYLKIPFWNSEMIMQRSMTKLSCMVQLVLNGVTVPNTTFSLAGNHLKQATYPFVLKSPTASRGRSNYFVSNENELRDIQKMPTYYLIQPFLENDHDLRVICFNAKPELILMRSRGDKSESHLNNTSQGGSAVWRSLSEYPSELLTTCNKICKIMKREMAGIDFIPDAASPFGYSCLEVNAIPQLTSGFGVDEKMASLSRSIIDSLDER